jgi:3-methyladenine DNA glycosylase AlkC
MNLLDEPIQNQIRTGILNPFVQGDVDNAVHSIPQVLDAMIAAIPPKKRISFGRYSAIKILAEHLYTGFEKSPVSPLEVGVSITSRSEDTRGVGVGLGILSIYGLDDYASVLPHFEAAAGADHWEPREYAQGLFRKIIKKHPQEIKVYLLKLVQSGDPNLRRFVSETLRPVVENRWLYRDIEYSLSILRHLFRESHPYPRTSVGNNLSDIARRKPELVYSLVAELVAMDDRHAAWIAARACRNLVKTDPLRVMDLLGVNEYRYKTRIYRRGET